MKKEKRRYAYFVQRPRRIGDLLRLHPAEDEKPYSLEKRIALKEVDYENFCQDRTVSRGYLENCCNYGPKEQPLACVLLYCKKTPHAGGVLVTVGKGGFVQWAAFVNNAKKTK